MSTRPLLATRVGPRRDHLRRGRAARLPGPARPLDPRCREGRSGRSRGDSRPADRAPSPRTAPDWARALLVLAAFAFLVLSMAGPGRMLCIGTDGHFAIEAESASCCDAPHGGCSQGPDAEPEPEAAPVHEPASEDGCIDVRLGFDARRGGSSRDLAPESQPVEVSHAVALPGSPWPAAYVSLPAVRPVPGVAPPPRPLRPLVLRC